MIFLYAASDTFAPRAKVLTDSITKYHPTDTVFHLKPTDGPLGTYIEGMAKLRLEKALQLLEDTEEDVCIIGADCELFDEISLDHLHDIYLVPHTKAPLANRDYMKQIYNSGHANADFMVFRNCHNSRQCLRWLVSVVKDNSTPGDFYEQTWLSSVPFLFDNVQIIRHSGYNVGYWDINYLPIMKHEDKYYFNGKPLVLFQYSGYVKGDPNGMSKHSPEKCISDLRRSIYERYDALIEN